MAFADLGLLSKSLIVLLWLCILWWWQKWAAFRPQSWQKARVLSNIGLWGINILLSILVYWPLQRWFLDVNPSDTAILLIFHLLVLDLWIYAWHWLTHYVPFLWRFHKVHHLDEQLDVTSAVRFHFGEVILSFMARVPVILLFQIPLSTLIIFETLVLCSALFHHANILLPKRLDKILNWFIITPNLHWVHHDAWVNPKTHNYGTILSLWDRVFRTRNNGPRQKDMRLGVGKEKDQNLWHLVIFPFRKV